MEWEQLTPDDDGTRKVIEGLERARSRESGGRRRRRPGHGRATDSAQLRCSGWERDPNAGDPSEHMGELRVFGALLEINSPRRCYWNGHRWVCF